MLKLTMNTPEVDQKNLGKLFFLKTNLLDRKLSTFLLKGACILHPSVKHLKVTSTFYEVHFTLLGKLVFWGFLAHLVMNLCNHALSVVGVSIGVCVQPSQ